MNNHPTLQHTLTFFHPVVKISSIFNHKHLRSGFIVCILCRKLKKYLKTNSSCKYQNNNYVNDTTAILIIIIYYLFFLLNIDHFLWPSNKGRLLLAQRRLQSPILTQIHLISNDVLYPKQRCIKFSSLDSGMGKTIYAFMYMHHCLGLVNTGQFAKWCI